MYKKSNSSFNFSKNGNMNKNSNGSFSNTRLASSQVVRMAPRPFSPFYEESNLMLPRDRREINAWARHYYATDPTVGNAIDLHSTYPLSAFGVKCEDPYITKFFNQMLDDINFSTLIFDIGKEYNIIGEVFPYGELNPSTGMWEKVIVQNPDYMEVRSNNLANPMMSLIPDEELKRLATSSNPDDIALREQMSQEMLAYVYSGRNIPLKDFNISHISRKNSPYDVRGTSMLTRIYKDLMLRDKFRESLFAIADNHVNPLKVFKVGTADGTYRPTEDDLQAFRDMLAQATYDPNFTLVTHPGLEIQYVGSSGAILPLEGYLDRIQENILTGLYISKTFTSSEGPCVSSDTETLTKDGWKLYDEITEKDEIATVNPENGNLEFHKYTGRVKFDVDGDMMHFKNKSIDHLVSLNHKVWIKETGKNKEYKKIRADEVKPRYRFLSHMGWEGKKGKSIKIGNKNIPINDYMLLVGLYLSEGSIVFNGSDKNVPCGINISQVKYHKSGLNERYDIIKKILCKNYDVIERPQERRKNIIINNNLKSGKLSKSDISEGFTISDKELASHLLLTYGNGSGIKSIPSFIKEYSKEILINLLEGSKLGDGSNLNSHTDSYEIYTISKKMADDLQEIAMKCGYASKICTKIRKEPRKTIYRVKIYLKNKKNKLYEPTVCKKDIQRIPYKGWIYCFEVPNHLFVVRRNGYVTVTGNTYASSSVALEILQQRYVSFRTLLEKWLELKIFKPISKLHGFYKVVGGREELIIPKVNWDKINLKNSSEYQNMIKDLVRDHSVSKRTLHKALDLNYEEEMEQIKKEAEDQAEIEYKLNLPYVGPENINVSGEAKAEMPQEEQEQSEKKPPEGGGGSDFGGLGDMGGIGGDIGGDLGDAGLGEEMGTEASPDLSTGGGAESAPAI